MANIDDLENKIKELEERVKRLEDSLTSFNKDREIMDALYNKAKELVLKHNKSSAIFLQRKLLIDYPRAVNLIERLRIEGVI